MNKRKKVALRKHRMKRKKQRLKRKAEAKPGPRAAS
jgi:hypothetical protein